MYYGRSALPLATIGTQEFVSNIINVDECGSGRMSLDEVFLENVLIL